MATSGSDMGWRDVQRLDRKRHVVQLDSMTRTPMPLGRTSFSKSLSMNLSLYPASKVLWYFGWMRYVFKGWRREEKRESMMQCIESKPKIIDERTLVWWLTSTALNKCGLTYKENMKSSTEGTRMERPTQTVEWGRWGWGHVVGVGAPTGSHKRRDTGSKWEPKKEDYNRHHNHII